MLWRGEFAQLRLRLRTLTIEPSPTRFLELSVDVLYIVASDRVVAEKLIVGGGRLYLILLGRLLLIGFFDMVGSQ